MGEKTVGEIFRLFRQAFFDGVGKVVLPFGSFYFRFLFGEGLNKIVKIGIVPKAP